MSSSSGRMPPSLPSLHHLETDPSVAGMALGAYITRELLMREDETSDLIDFGAVQVNGRQERNPRALLSGRETIRIHWPHGGTRRHYEVDPIRVVYRDKWLLAYDKEAGIPTQQTPSDAYNNLFAALRRSLAKESRAENYIALHHRLDRETSGVILFTIDKEANRRLGNAFQQRQVTKDYLAWVSGNAEEDRWISSEGIGRKDGRYCIFPKGSGKSAETAFRVLHRESGRTLVWARPKTGRTHQIRLHLAVRGMPVLGDRLYGNERAERLYLHAFRLILPHPMSRSPLILTAPVPADYKIPREISLPAESSP